MNALVKWDVAEISKSEDVSSESCIALLHQGLAEGGFSSVSRNVETPDRLLNHLEECMTAIGRLSDVLSKAIKDMQKEDVFDL